MGEAQGGGKSAHSGSDDDEVLWHGLTLLAEEPNGSGYTGVTHR